jgi:hypothetical protein
MTPKIYQRSLVSLFLIFNFTSAFAQINKVEKDLSGKTLYSVDIVDVEEVIHKSHEIIEGQETGNFFEDWKEAFRLKKKLIDASRWVSSSKETSFEGIILDSVLLFGMSHSLEMSSGPAMVGVGVSQHWPDWLTAALGMTGAVISVPGLDPLCMLVFGIYYKSPLFRAGIGKLRVGLVSGTKFVGGVTGARALIKKIFVRPEYKEWLSEMEHLDEFRELEDGRVVAKFSYPSLREPEIQLEVQFGADRPFLKSVFVANNISWKNQKLSIPWLKKFGWNTNDFVTHGAVQSILQSSAATKPYIEDMFESESGKTIILRNSAVPMGKKWQIATQPKKCIEIFKLSRMEAVAAELGVL